MERSRSRERKSRRDLGVESGGVILVGLEAARPAGYAFSFPFSIRLKAGEAKVSWGPKSAASDYIYITP